MNESEIDDIIRDIGLESGEELLRYCHIIESPMPSLVVV